MNTLTNRTFSIVKGALKVADKNSDAVAYVYDRNGQLFAQMFFGKQAKPVWHYRFRTEADRAKRIADAFASRQQVAAYRNNRKAERAAETHNLQVGHVLVASWGYDQTNVDFYQVTKIISDKMVEVRKIASMSGAALSSMSGTVLPVIDHFTGEPMRKRAGRGSIKIDSSRWASVWDGKPKYESSYH